MSLRDSSSGERKIDTYYGCYDKHFEALKDEELNILEIGVQHGGSLRLWTKYFPNAKVVGIDIDPHCKELDVNGATVEIGDQADVEFLRHIDRTYGTFDIIIDDGGHTMHQQQISFETLYPLLKKGGLYVIEDLHTSYWGEFQDAPKTTIDVLKDYVDFVNVDATASQRSNRPRMNPPYDIKELHFYPSMVFIQK